MGRTKLGWDFGPDEMTEVPFWVSLAVEEGQRERETQNPKQAPGSELSAQSLTRGSNPPTVRS